MAKQKELTKLRRTNGGFTLVGKAKIGEYTFNTDAESAREDSDWVYSQMKLGVDCGQNHGLIYCELMGGYGTDRQNYVRVPSIKVNKNGVKVDDFENMLKIDWEDRFNEEILKNVGKLGFITVGLEKEKEKVEYKKFLSAYDAVGYVEEHLEDGMTVTIKGDLKWSIYKENIQVRKEVTSIILSKAEEDDFKAIFNQNVILDTASIGKFDKETMTIPIDCRILEYMKDYNGTEVKTILPIHKSFDLAIDGSDKERATKMLKVFKVKGKKLDLLNIDGMFVKGDTNTVKVTVDDIPDDVKELIELGYVSEADVLEKMTFVNGGNNKAEKMMIKSPHIKYTGEDMKIPTIDKVIDMYSEEDLDIAAILENMGIKDPLDVALEDTDSDDSEDNWLDELN